MIVKNLSEMGFILLLIDFYQTSQTAIYEISEGHVRHTIIQMAFPFLSIVFQ